MKRLNEKDLNKLRTSLSRVLPRKYAICILEEYRKLYPKESLPSRDYVYNILHGRNYDNAILTIAIDLVAKKNKEERNIKLRLKRVPRA